jgi:hypothetical protein
MNPDSIKLFGPPVLQTGIRSWLLVGSMILLVLAALVANPNLLASLRDIPAKKTCQPLPTTGEGLLQGHVHIIPPVGDKPNTLITIQQLPCFAKQNKTPTVPESCQEVVGKTGVCEYGPVETPIVLNDPMGLAKGLGEKDEVFAVFENLKSQNPTLKRINLVLSEPQPMRGALTTLIVGLSLICFLWAVLERGFLQLCIGKDNRYSNSQTQVAVWFFVLITVFLTTLILRLAYAGSVFATGINVPNGLFVLSGLSALVFVGAKITTEVQVSTNPASKSNAEKPQPSDLYSDDAGVFDLTDFQMIVVTIVAVLGYVFAFFAFIRVIPHIGGIELPDVNGTMVALFGAGQGAYLVRKVAEVSRRGGLIPPLAQQEINGSVGTALNVPATTTGGKKPYTHKITPDLPTALSLDPTTGQISGTPTAPLPATVYQLEVTDKDGRRWSTNVQITIS